MSVTEEDSGLVLDSSLELKSLIEANDPDPDIVEEEDIEDETLVERLMGLTEMFPEWIRTSSSSAASMSVGGISTIVTISRSLMWMFFSSSCVLIAPVLFEVERGQIEEAQKQQQRQMLLGPSSAVPGNQGSGIGMPMPGPPMPQR